MERLAEGPVCGKCRRPLFEGRPIALTDQNFDRYLTRSELPLVVDFWAPWCGPCKAMAPAYFKDGQPVASQPGAMGPVQLVQWIERHL